MLILLSLGCLIILSLFSLIVGASLQQVGLQTIDIDTIKNNSAFQYSIDDFAESFYIDEFIGAIVIIIAIVSVCIIIGFRILNSGLSDQSVKMVTMGITYVSLWAIFSALAYTLIVSIEIIGATIYIILTLMYVIGIIQKFMDF